MTEEKDRIFRVKKGDEEVELFVKNPSLQERERAESVRLKKWTQAALDGAIFAEKLNDLLEKQGIWSKEKQARRDEIQEEIIDSIRILNKGGILKSVAKKIAIKIRQLRIEDQYLSMGRIKYVNDTVEGQAQNAEYNYLVSQCAVYNSDRNKKYFDSYEDYLNRINDLDAYLISKKCANVFYNIGDEETWPENEFLLKYGYINKDLRLINKDGHLIDINGKLIDEYGNNVEIRNGVEVSVDENGEILEVNAEPLPFIDDEEEEVIAP